jgi:hypothetical protein
MHAALAGLDLRNVTRRLGTRRPVFHAEADLQQELAWQVHLLHPAVHVRLEVRIPEPSRPGRRERVDALIHGPHGPVAVEVKYLTDALTATHENELFVLPRQGAQDITGYDVAKDLHRIEHFIRTGFAAAGAVLVVSNDPSYWTDPGHGRATGAAAFRLYDGRTLTGELAWGVQAGPGTRKGREDPLVIAGAHALTWEDFSTVPGHRRGRFRFLLIEVEPV